MDKRLTRGMSDADKQAFLESAIHNSHVVDVIKAAIVTILEEKLMSLKKEDYNVANWACLAADRNGEIRALTSVHALLESIGPKERE